MPIPHNSFASGVGNTSWIAEPPVPSEEIDCDQEHYDEQEGQYAEHEESDEDIRWMNRSSLRNSKKRACKEKTQKLP